ncbi:MAG TPA: MarR family transcriptional regulator [Candidatus Saccharimonadales bacterium]|nr:MarR family transcriptional regulator [Candidatus Saccharimonadales bacterium]
MDKSGLQDNLLWQLLLVSFRGKKGLIQIADEYGLTFVQVYTLCSILPDKPLSMNEIANMLNCDASNVTGIIDRLFAQEYIVRQEKPGDRRVKIISLTPKGEKLRQEIVAKIIAYRSESLDKLNDSEKDKLSTLLRKILA